MNDVFRAGVGPGGLTNDYELKVLICCMLKECRQTIPCADLLDIIVAEELGNYFEAASAAAGLEKSGHITSDQEGFALTTVGKNAADELGPTLPPAARDKALAALERYFVFHASSSAANASADIRPSGSGYYLELSLAGDMGRVLLRLELFLTDKKSCDALARRFAADPIFVYTGIVGLLTGNVETPDDLSRLLRGAIVTPPKK